MATLNETPSANRLHIGIFGKTNSGKSSFINALTGQEVSIVSKVRGTTTDPVYKAMEIHPIGPVSIIDTAGFDDITELGEIRMEKTKEAADKTELAVMLFSTEDLMPGDGVDISNLAEPDDESQETPDRRDMLHGQEATSCDKPKGIGEIYAKELEWIHYFQEKKTPVLMVVNKIDLVSEEQRQALVDWLRRIGKDEPVCVSALTCDGMEMVKVALTRKVPEDFDARDITGGLVTKEDLVLLVMPQDIQAPKGRLILPQVQTIRELLDKKCLVMSVTTDQMLSALVALKQAPKLIITDSQVFKYVYENKPEESMLTSFSVLFAAYKGDLPYYVEGAKAIDSLSETAKVLIAECCTHAPLQEDIGRVKIPNMLKKRFGQGIQVDHVSGTDFPEDLSGYDLIIQCGACMFNRKYVMSRIEKAKAQKVAMTNYGVTIAHLTGILDQVAKPEA